MNTLPELLKMWKTPWRQNGDGIWSADGCWIMSATNSRLAYQLIDLANYAARVTALEERLAAFKSERSYVIGFNTGWEEAEGGENTRAETTELLFEGLEKDYRKVVAAFDAQRATVSTWKRNCQYLIDILDGQGFASSDLSEEDDDAIAFIRASLGEATTEI